MNNNMNNERQKKISKFLSLVLRHEPQAIGIDLDESGWVETRILLDALERHGRGISLDELRLVVENNDKKRFAFSEDQTRIRASQGHSVEVDLGYTPVQPPECLYHGTTDRFVEAIRAAGLQRRDRHHVHLSAQTDTAVSVGSRHGRPVLLTVHAGAMHRAGRAFYQSANGVWLTDEVPSEFIDFPRMVSEDRSEQRRNTRSIIARDTLAALEKGGYQTQTGRWIDFAAWQREAVSNSALLDAEAIGRRPLPEPASPADIAVTDESAMAAMARLAGAGCEDIGCLNFASAKNPGGGFLNGAQAQEEALARSSGLYPALLANPAYYERNRARRSALYLDLLQVAPGVPFFRDDEGGWLENPYRATVITAPAPNAGAVEQNEPESLGVLPEVLARRAELVLRLAASEGIRHLVLGAWGCGVFRNDPRLVAQTFARLLDQKGPWRSCFSSVIFAVYDRLAGQPVLNAFQRVFPENPT